MEWLELYAEISPIVYQTYLLKANWEYTLPCQEPSLVPTDNSPHPLPPDRVLHPPFLSPPACPENLWEVGAVATLGLPERLSETLVPSHQSLLVAALPTNLGGDREVLKAFMFRSLQQNNLLRFPLRGAYCRDAPAQGRDGVGITKEASFPASPLTTQVAQQLLV